MIELELRFNGGVGALLCPHCRAIISYGFDHDHRIYKCSNCDTTTHVVEVDKKYYGKS